MNDIVYGGYPTEKFPSEYTKQGQAVLMQKFLSGQIEEKQNITAQSREISEPTDTQQSTTTQSNIDMHKLMPLIKSMSQNKSISKSELMKIVLPLLSGSNDYNDLISLMIDKNMQEKDMLEMSFESDSNKPKIASFKRVE